MSDWKAEYRPWDAIFVGDMPVPYAMGCGVPITHVQMPGAVAAPSAEALIKVAQVVAFMKVCVAKSEYDEYRFHSMWEHLAGKLYDPGLLHLVCPACGEHCDAWVGDDGRLQDARDLVCAQTHNPTLMTIVLP